MKFMGKAVVAMAAVGLAAGSVIGAGAANAEGKLYGAIAFSSQQWSYGTGVDWTSREYAIEEALFWCELDGASDCVVLVDWSDGCGALVYTDGAVATGAGFNSSAALFAAHTSLARYHPPAFLANVGSADKSDTEISEVVCTANAS
ncbi:DUF4189 domain-containing protein [Nocardia neocaledoniensis]|uniref:DUF4189 domain-containing protein n=1 Tax=Nocardia neocaledoniensis TaxID=236511 RepID=UPI0024590FE8|nr:DUF4189 domain-containing protein [Nocardia neocaledoniensis]